VILPSHQCRTGAVAHGCGDALDLKEGDQIEIRIARERVFEVSRDQSKPHALARLRKLRRRLPPGFVFDREEANAR
jgi:antitoxin MazE